MATVTSKTLLVCVCLSTISAIVLCNGVQTATAGVPVVAKIENLSQGTTGKIFVTINNPGASSSATGTHFIDIIEVDVDGKVQQFTYENPSISGVTPFMTELDIGKIKATSVVKVRAHCTVDEWGAWSDAVAVPEFPVAALVSVVALAATLLIMKRQSQIRR